MKRESGKASLDKEDGLEMVLTFPTLDMVDDTYENKIEDSKSLRDIEILSFSHKDCENETLTGGKGSSLGISTKVLKIEMFESFPI